MSDEAVRGRSFQFLDEMRVEYGDELPRSLLLKGFDFEGRRVPLISAQRGIFKPAALDFPLSFMTSPIVEGRARPYEDSQSEEGLIHYRYFGRDPEHRDNVGMRRAMAAGVPMVYFLGIVPGWYEPIYPAFVVQDDPGSLTFTVAVDDRSVLRSATVMEVAEPLAEIRRQYITRSVLQRVHQVAFRRIVLRAYRRRCTVCRLHQERLLDAAHILEDRDPRGEPRVSNALSLCKLHHAAFDHHLMGIRPDLVVDVPEKVRRQADGPMLVHGLQDCHGRKLEVLPTAPSERPNPDFLEERFSRYQRAG